MKKINKLLIAILGAYLIYLGFAFIWFYPTLVDQRLSSKIHFGMQGKDISKILGINEPFDIADNKYCAGKSDMVFGKISLYTAGGMVLLPFPVVISTTTTFCFNSENKLIAFKSRRWVDGP